MQLQQKGKLMYISLIVVRYFPFHPSSTDLNLSLLPTLFHIQDFYMIGQLPNDVEIQLETSRKINDIFEEMTEIKNFVVKRRGEVTTPS